VITPIPTSVATLQSMLPISNPVKRLVNMQTHNLLSQSTQQHSPLQPPLLYA